jgi:hypothetical protein
MDEEFVGDVFGRVMLFDDVVDVLWDVGNW